MCDKRSCVCRKGAKAVRPNDDKLRELEDAYAKFMQAEGDSLLKKHLTKTLFDALKTRATIWGSILTDVIQSGLKNPDSSVGIYAPDPKAYDVFAELFDPVIEEYHVDFKPDDVHPDLDWGEPEKLGNLDPTGKHVVSTRIRCVRSIKGYPFNPIMNEIHFYEVERKVQEALTSLKDELKGTYYTLRALDKQIRRQLIDDHFLSKEGNRFLRAANAIRFWPMGRGIFFNEEKTFLVWCNVEDHMRLISMERGGNLAAVYGRLVKAVQEIGKKLEFQRHRRLGFLTSCPTNLGTTIRASVHVRLPKLSADYRRFEEIAAMHGLQIREMRGKQAEDEVCIYNISNRRRLGLMEREALYEMRNGVAELIKLERQLERRIS